MDSRGYKLVILAVTTFSLVSCTAWRPETVSPPRIIEGEVRITRMDGSRVTLRDPEARPDSLVGESTAVAIADIQRLEVLDSAGVFTLFLLSVVALVVVPRAGVYTG